MADESVQLPENQRKADDLEIFDALARAQRQYEEYLKITEASSVVQIWSDAVVAPPADESLSLVIWPEDRESL